MDTKKYYHYITGLKGISCILIMIGHYLGIYKYSQQFIPRIYWLDTILNSRLSFLIDEGYWLYLFFFLSGYLVSKTKVESINKIILKSIKRFFRFAFPIFFSCLIIYLMYTLIGFHNGSTIDLFLCNWFQGYYSKQYSVMHVLRSPIDVLFFGNAILNGPYWVLREMFLASIIIYILKYLYFILSKKREVLCFSVLIIISFAFSFVSPIISACLIGMFISIYEEVEKIVNKSYFAFWMMIIALAQYFFNGMYLFNLFFVFLIIFVPKVNFIDKVLSSNLLRFLGEISWGVYSFHWPLICSIGALLIVELHPQIGLLDSYTTACCISLCITFVVSIIFRYTIDPICSALCLRVDRYLNRIISIDILKSWE